MFAGAATVVNAIDAASESRTATAIKSALGLPGALPRTGA